MYARYWQPAGIAHYLEEAALYSKDHKSTVSITDSVSRKSNCIYCIKMNYDYVVNTVDIMAYHQ